MLGELPCATHILQVALREDHTGGGAHGEGSLDGRSDIGTAAHDAYLGRGLDLVAPERAEGGLVFLKGEYLHAAVGHGCQMGVDADGDLSQVTAARYHGHLDTFFGIHREGDGRAEVDGDGLWPRARGGNGGHGGGAQTHRGQTAEVDAAGGDAHRVEIQDGVVGESVLHIHVDAGAEVLELHARGISLAAGGHGQRKHLVVAVERACIMRREDHRGGSIGLAAGTRGGGNDVGIERVEIAACYERTAAILHGIPMVAIVSDRSRGTVDPHLVLVDPLHRGAVHCGLGTRTRPLGENLQGPLGEVVCIIFCASCCHCKAAKHGNCSQNRKPIIHIEFKNLNSKFLILNSPTMTTRWLCHGPRGSGRLYPFVHKG